MVRFLLFSLFSLSTFFLLGIHVLKYFDHPLHFIHAIILLVLFDMLSRSLHFYSLTLSAVTGYALNIDYDIKRLLAAPLCLEYMVEKGSAKKSYLAWGDTQGMCILMRTVLL